MGDKKLQIIIAFGAVLSATIGILAYVENKRHSKISNEVLALEKEIKTLELEKRRSEAVMNGRRAA